MTHEEIIALHQRIDGILRDAGWPPPWMIYSDEFERKSLVWRRSDKGSALIFETDASNHPVRHKVLVQVILWEERVLIDLTPLPLWPGEHSADVLAAVLRHFRSVIEPP